MIRSTCPGCGTQYKISRDKVGPKGIRLKCRKCSHVFRVEAAPRSLADMAGDLSRLPDDFPFWDFREVGVGWRLRTERGRMMPFHRLKDLERLVEDGTATEDAQVSYDLENWTRLGDVHDRAQWFPDKWDEAEEGEISSIEGNTFGDDAPTAIFNIKGGLLEQ